MEKYFELNKNKTSIKRELLAGFTTFVSMAYILFVNPSVLKAAGMDQGAVFTATAIISAIATIFMGVVAKYPFAIAPGLGINAFFAYSVVLGMGIKWQTALAGVFVAGIIFFVMTIFKIRELVINAIPNDLKAAIAAGIGMFIAFIGLHDSGIIISNKDTMVAIGDLSQPLVLLSIFGIILTLILHANKVPGAIFIGMAATSILGIALKLIDLPTKWVSLAPSLQPTFGRAISGLSGINSMQMVVVILTFLLIAFFDTAGTLIGLAKDSGFLNKKGELPRSTSALMADSIGMLGGSILGTSPTTAYIESSSGIAVGGRTGLTSVFTGLFFGLSLFFSPLLAVVTTQVTAAPLVLIGVLMIYNLTDINWSDFPTAAAATITAIGMPLTYSISNGIALGFVVYPILMIATGRFKQVNPAMYVLGFIFVLFLIIVN